MDKEVTFVGSLEFVERGEGSMIVRKVLIPALLAYAVLSFACVYIVLPEGLEFEDVLAGSESGVWSAVVTEIGESEAGDLHIDITIRNDTGDWSTMQAAPDKPALLTTSDGKTANCDTVFIGTGGHRLAPGFQMRGYTAGKKSEPVTQLLYVECQGTTATAGSTLSIEYVSFGGALDDYNPELNESAGTLELNLDEVVQDLSYPIAVEVDGLIQEPGVGIPALSENVVTLLDVQRTDDGFQFNWQNYNPTKFPLKTHIGTPPVIGSDGVIHGIYESLDIVPIPITPATETMEWSTEVAVPPDVDGFYILLGVESNKPRTYVFYAVDISDK
jgi:hypothetical protein